MKIEVDDKNIINKLDKLQGKKYELALNKCCIQVENTAKEKCPVDSGQLRNSIKHKVESGVGEVGTNVSYAPYVEYGTGLFSSKGTGRKSPWSYQDTRGQWHTTAGQKPQPFLIPALNENKDFIIENSKKNWRVKING